MGGDYLGDLPEIERNIDHWKGDALGTNKKTEKRRKLERYGSWGKGDSG